jgi:hypothetical protein
LVLGLPLAEKYDSGDMYFGRDNCESFTPLCSAFGTKLKYGVSLRVKVQGAAASTWGTLVEQAEAVSVEAVQRLEESRDPDFGKVLEYDNTKLEETLLPLYHQMAQLFRENGSDSV